GDFRALDTLFEGLVLIITGLGIYTLLNYQDRKGHVIGMLEWALDYIVGNIEVEEL
ncbi:hypothetical protein, partial [Staphylococcus aureus]|uniref:hypothetical protein n=1 Tax=Staphylococcus aureus TaxID=1280 RepID=UPI0035CCF70E